MSTYQERQAYRHAHPGVVVDNTSSSDGGFHSSTPDGTSSGGGGSGSSSSSGGSANTGGSAPASSSTTAGDGQSLGNQSAETQAAFKAQYGDQAEQQWVTQHNQSIGYKPPADPLATTPGGPPPQQPTATDAASKALGDQIQKLMNAIGSGNAAAAAEVAREFNATFGLDEKKFAQAVDQYNQDHAMAVTQQAANIAAQQAGLTGMFNGQPTEQARQFNATQGMQALQLAAGQQADPFRQQQVLYNLAQGGFLAPMRAVAGLGSAPQYQAWTGSAADSATLPYLANQVTQYGGGGSGPQAPPSTTATSAATPPQTTFQAPTTDPQHMAAFYSNVVAGGSGSPSAPTMPANSQYSQALDALPPVHQWDAGAFFRMPSTSQNYLLSAAKAKYGIEPVDATATLKATQPQFQAPTLSGSATI